jgi:predicted PurR-regulated permease PerM
MNSNTTFFILIIFLLIVIIILISISLYYVYPIYDDYIKLTNNISETRNSILDRLNQIQNELSTISTNIR